MRKILSVLFFAVSVTASGASTFWPGTVVGVAYNDVLNVRKWPSAQSRILGVYNNGDDLGMTGRCKSTITNNSFRIDGNQSPAWKRARMQKSNVWCQVVTTDGRVGWVRGRFVEAD
jgi:Bacterial SH3 domain